MQLTIFDVLESMELEDQNDFISKKASLLLEALNDGLKKTEQYLPHYWFQEKENIVLIAVNKHKDVLFNVIDGETGETPVNFSACWRNLEHIKQELNIK